MFLRLLHNTSHLSLYARAVSAASTRLSYLLIPRLRHLLTYASPCGLEENVQALSSGKPRVQ